MKDKTICYKRGDEKKKSVNRIRGIMVRRKMVAGMMKRRS